MYQRLTKFIYELRRELPDRNIAGGLAIGIGDAFYKVATKPKEGSPIPFFDVCPSCGSRGTILATQVNDRIVGKCNNCVIIATSKLIICMAR